MNLFVDGQECDLGDYDFFASTLKEIIVSIKQENPWEKPSTFCFLIFEENSLLFHYLKQFTQEYSINQTLYLPNEGRYGDNAKEHCIGRMIDSASASIFFLSPDTKSFYEPNIFKAYGAKGLVYCVLNGQIINNINNLLE